MLILQIDTSTTVCSCALSKNGVTLRSLELNEMNVHASQLTLLIQSLLADAQVAMGDLDVIAVSMGPGSYTGLRIGVSTAKGLCYALDIPLVAVSTLEAMTWGFIKQAGAAHSADWYIPMIDARRMEVYMAVYDAHLQCLEATSAQIIDERSFASLSAHKSAVLFGNGANKVETLFQNQPNIHVIPGFETSASYLSTRAYEKAQQALYEDVAYFEPFYLKEFVATTPKAKP